MIYRKEEKQIEEHIRQLFQNYSPSVSDEEKSEIINAFQNLHIHDNSLRINIKEILKNKTLQFIVIAITSTVLLIYLFAKLFPAEEKDNPSNDNYIEQTSLEDSVGTVIQQNTTSPVDTTSSSTKPALTHSSTNTTSVITTNTNSITHSDSNKILKQNITTIQTDTSKIIKKKKKKKINSESSNNDSENNSPILEPKTPQLNTPVKEEE
jgi:hypothetical protein